MRRSKTLGGNGWRGEGLLLAVVFRNRKGGLGRPLGSVNPFSFFERSSCIPYIAITAVTNLVTVMTRSAEGFTNSHRLSHKVFRRFFHKIFADLHNLLVAIPTQVAFGLERSEDFPGEARADACSGGKGPLRAAPTTGGMVGKLQEERIGAVLDQRHSARLHVIGQAAAQFDEAVHRPNR